MMHVETATEIYYTATLHDDVDPTVEDNIEQDGEEADHHDHHRQDDVDLGPRDLRQRRASSKPVRTQ
eukprot:11020747-Prorocentrum_lima.AAC.1